MSLRVCERFKKDPAEFWAMDAVEQRAYLDFERLRQAEEQRELELMAKAAMAGGAGAGRSGA